MSPVICYCGVLGRRDVILTTGLARACSRGVARSYLRGLVKIGLMGVKAQNTLLHSVVGLGCMKSCRRTLKPAVRAKLLVHYGSVPKLTDIGIQTTRARLKAIAFRLAFFASVTCPEMLGQHRN